MRPKSSSQAGTPHDCDEFFELYSLPAWPAAGTWRIRGWDKKVEYVAAHATPAGGAPPSRWRAANASRRPAPLSVACNRTADDSYRPPRMVPAGVAEQVPGWPGPERRRRRKGAA